MARTDAFGRMVRAGARTELTVRQKTCDVAVGEFTSSSSKLETPGASVVCVTESFGPASSRSAAVRSHFLSIDIVNNPCQWRPSWLMFLALVLIISVLGIVGTYLAFSAVYFVEMRKLDK